MTKARQLSKLLGGSVPSALDTLNEIATALGNDASLATTLTNAIATKQNSLGYTPVNKAGDTMTGALDIQGVIKDTSGTGKVYTKLTPYYDYYTNGSTAGAIVIDTAIPYNDSNMCAFKLAGYYYNGALPWEINLSGYFGENNFYSLGAYSQAHPFGSYIRVAKKTSTNTMSLILGDVSGVYGTGIYVERFLQSYSNVNASYANGWTISRLTSLSAYSSITSVTQFNALNLFPTLQTSMTKLHIPGGLGYGEQGQGRYVLGWYQAAASSASTYMHIKTNLWGGGSPRGNDMYIMGGFRITGYIYSTSNIDDLIQFHNWSGSMAGLVRTCKASDVGNTAYVGSDGYVYLRLRSDVYAAYDIDLYQHTIYPTRDISVVSTTFSNSAGL